MAIRGFHKDQRALIDTHYSELLAIVRMIGVRDFDSLGNMSSIRPPCPGFTPRTSLPVSWAASLAELCATGSGATDTGLYCSRPSYSSITIPEPATAPQTGYMWAPPTATASTPPRRPRWRRRPSFCAPCIRISGKGSSRRERAVDTDLLMSGIL
jgi:hypothetical protein